MLEIKNTVTEMKNAFDGLTSGLYIAEKSVSELKNVNRNFHNENNDWRNQNSSAGQVQKG
jgi:hypothetical protein